MQNVIYFIIKKSEITCVKFALLNSEFPSFKSKPVIALF